MICPACEKEVDRLIKHHWFEAPDMEQHEKEICDHCNSLLSSNNFYPKEEYENNRANLNHVLPNWEEQLEFIKKKHSHFSEWIIWHRTYDIEPTPFDEKEGEYYRVVLGFDDLEDAKKCLDKWIDAGDIQEGYWHWGE